MSCLALSENSRILRMEPRDVLDDLGQLVRAEDEHGEDHERHQLERSYVIEHLEAPCVSRSSALVGRYGSGPRSTVPGAYCRCAVRFRWPLRPAGPAGRSAGRHVPVPQSRGQRDRPFPAAALEGELQPVAGAVGADLDDQFLAAVHPLAVELGDDVAGLEAGLGAGAARGDRRLRRSLLVLADARAVAGVLHVEGDADHRVDRLAGLDQLLGDALGLVDRDGEAEADASRPGRRPASAAAVGGPDGGVDADDPGLGVEQRAAGVAGVDRGVGLQRVTYETSLPSPFSPPAVIGPFLGADDAGGDGVRRGRRGRRWRPPGRRPARCRSCRAAAACSPVTPFTLMTARS